MKEYDVSLSSMMTKLISRKNIQILFEDIPTAKCIPSEKTIVFPIRFIGLDRDIMSLFSGHEAGHMLHSPNDLSKYEGTVDLNAIAVFEDIRIENKIKNEFAGIVSMFSRAYSRLNSEFDFFSILSKDVNKLSFLDRINLKAKLRNSIDIRFSTSELEFFKRLDAINTFEDVIAMSKEYALNFSENKMEEMKKQNKLYISCNTNISESDELNESGKSTESGESTESTESGESGESGESTESGESAESGKSAESGESVESGESAESGESGGFDDVNESGESSGFNESSEFAGFGGINESFIPIEGETIFAANDWMKSFHPQELKTNNNRKRYSGSYIGIQKLLTFKELSEFIVSWKEISEIRRSSSKKITDINDFVSSNNYKRKRRLIQNTASVMANEFFAKKSATGYAKIKESPMGEINPNKLVHYKYMDNIFLTSKHMPNEKNHGLILIVDISGSMTSIIRSVLFQVLILTEYCRLTGIPFEVYAFTDELYNIRHWAKFKDDSIGYERYYLNWFSSRMTNFEYMSAFNEILYSHQYGFGSLSGKIDVLGGTPLNEARADAVAFTDEFINRTNVEKFSLIFLTDGAGNRTKVSDFVSWKNKIYHETRYSDSEYLYWLYKKIYPNYNMINLFFTNNSHFFSNDIWLNFVNTGFHIAKFQSNRYQELFDMTYYIDSGLLQRNNMIVSARSSIDYNEGADEVLNQMENDFISKGKLAKKVNLISKSVIKILA